MKTVCLVSVFIDVCTVTVVAQSNDHQTAINEQVWKPFIKYYNSRDRKGFASVHSKDVARVSQDDNRILNASEYFKEPSEAQKARNADRTLAIELRFIQRIANEDKAFEVGYYKTTTTDIKTGVVRTNYGKFHVLLIKEEGKWKILMDADANDKTDEAVFLTGKPLE